MTLGHEWTNVAIIDVRRGQANVTFYIDVKLNRQEGNRSIIDARLTSTIVNSLSGSGYEFQLTGANIIRGNDVWTFGNGTILTGQYSVEHDADGYARNVGVEAYVANSYWNFAENLRGVFDLPRIAKAPKLSELNISEITYNSVKVDFSVTEDGGSSVNDYYIDLFTDSELKEKTSTASTKSYVFTNLSPNKVYYARGNASNSAGRSYTAVKQFKTEAGVVRFKVNNVWKEAIPYIKKNGKWNLAISYIKINGMWKEVE